MIVDIEMDEEELREMLEYYETSELAASYPTVISRDIISITVDASDELVSLLKRENIAYIDLED